MVRAGDETRGIPAREKISARGYDLPKRRLLSSWRIGKRKSDSTLCSRRFCGLELRYRSPAQPTSAGLCRPVARLEISDGKHYPSYRYVSQEGLNRSRARGNCWIQPRGGNCRIRDQPYLAVPCSGPERTGGA